MKHSSLNEPLRFVGLIVLQVLVILWIEAYCVRNGQRSADELAIKNRIQDQANNRLKAEIRGLKISQSKIKALFFRLNDAIYSPRAIERIQGQAPGKLAPGSLRQPEEPPSTIKQLAEAGIVARQQRVPTGESAVIYEAGSSSLELQRLIPVLAEQENSNAFLFFDRLYLSRPALVPAFSIDPTCLDTRLTVRILSAR